MVIKLLSVFIALPLFLFSFSNSAPITVISYCGDYCSGYADGIEEERGGRISMEEWTALYNKCLSTCEEPISY